MDDPTTASPRRASPILALLLPALLVGCDGGTTIVDPTSSATVYGTVTGVGADTPLHVVLSVLLPGCTATTGLTADAPVGADGSYAAVLLGLPFAPGYQCVRAQLRSGGRTDSLVTVERDSVYFGSAETDSVRIDLAL